MLQRQKRHHCYLYHRPVLMAPLPTVPGKHRPANLAEKDLHKRVRAAAGEGRGGGELPS